MTTERHQTPQDASEWPVARFSAAMCLLGPFRGRGGNP